MRIQRQFGNANAVANREAAVISAMMNDLRRIVEILDCDVATEESRARVFDKSDPHYPILATSLAVRRDNLKLTVSALRRRLQALEPTAAIGAA